MSRERGLKAKMKLSDGFTIRYIHGYFHIHNEQTGFTIISPSHTSVKRFAKACLKGGRK